MQILITGADGFIGRNLVRAFCPQHTVYGLVRQPPASPIASVEWIKQDLSAPLDQAQLPERIDVVIHLAQSRYYRQFPEYARDIFAVNLASTFHLLEYARLAGAKCFILASTGGLYGLGATKFTETAPIAPTSGSLGFYFTSKYASELLTANYTAFFRTVMFRLFFVYGEGQTRMLIPNLLDKVQRQQTIVIEGNPGMRITPTYIGDAVCAFETALGMPVSGTFNIAGDESVSITELVQYMARVTGIPARIEHTNVTWTGDEPGDNTKMKEILGVYPQTPLAEGLRRMIG